MQQISGLSVNPALCNFTHGLVLSVFLGFLTELMGYKIKGKILAIDGMISWSKPSRQATSKSMQDCTSGGDESKFNNMIAYIHTWCSMVVLWDKSYKCHQKYNSRQTLQWEKVQFERSWMKR